MQNTLTLQKPLLARDSNMDFIPIFVQEIELSQPLPTLSAFDKQRKQTYQHTRCLVRLHTQPLGLVDFTLSTDELPPDEYAPRIWQALGMQINAHLREDGLPEVTRLDAAGLPVQQVPKCVEERTAFLQIAPFASVVISTRDRPDLLARCLSSLLTLNYPRYEVIVVDNAPSTSATADFIQQMYADEPKIRYVREDHPGASWGLNRGIVEARGDIIAITADDVVVDTHWLTGLAMGFRIAENVTCVTGLILPLELETPAQFLFESYVDFTKGFSRRIFDLREHRSKNSSYPYIEGPFSVGAGASMACTASFLRSEGGFDPALKIGEDIATFFGVIVNGHCLVYEPASLLYHQHRRDYTALQKQIYGYGVGFTAYLTKIIIDHPSLILDCIDKCVRYLFLPKSARPCKPEREAIPLYQDLRGLEWKGRFRGPLAYMQSRLACGWTKKGLALAQASANATRIKEVASSDQSQKFLVERIRQ